MTHSKFPWTTHPHTPTAVFDGGGRRIIDQWVAPATAFREGLEEAADIANRFADCSGSFVAERIFDAAAGVTIPSQLDPETAAANAVMIAGLPGLIEALEECVIRLRYDGDLFDNQGNEQRRDASWKAMEMAEAALASIGRTL